MARASERVRCPYLPSDWHCRCCCTRRFRCRWTFESSCLLPTIEAYWHVTMDDGGNSGAIDWLMTSSSDLCASEGIEKTFAETERRRHYRNWRHRSVLSSWMMYLHVNGRCWQRCPIVVRGSSNDDLVKCLYRCPRRGARRRLPVLLLQSRRSMISATMISFRV